VRDHRSLTEFFRDGIATRGLRIGIERDHRLTDCYRKKILRGDRMEEVLGLLRDTRQAKK
jgi:hypothetical protein